MPAQQDFPPDEGRAQTTARTLPEKRHFSRRSRPAAIDSEVASSGGESPQVVLTPPARRTSRARRVLFPLLSVGLALFAACGIAELGLRLCGYGRNYTNPMGSFFEPDNYVGCHGKPNFVGRFRRADFDALVEHDENGFRRGPERPGLPGAPAPQSPVDPHDRHDIYVLGDSYVWGYGVGQHDLLTNQMAGLLPGHNVHNLGLIGAGTVQEYLIFQKHVVDRLRPGDKVVLVFFGNDFGDNIGEHLDDRAYATIEHGDVRIVPPRPASAMQRWKSWMKDASCLFNLVSFCADRIQDDRGMKNLGHRETRQSPSPQQIAADTSDDSPAVQITRHYLAALQDDCRAKQVRFLAAYVPGQAELGEDDVASTSDLTLPEEIACRAAYDRMVRDLAIETVDLTAPMIAAKRDGRFPRVTFAHDSHWNAAGHMLAAETIAKAIKR